ncbi:16S rRNA (guanine(527)-N(7))-methyltransferase RsmG [Buchananella hordeovulneris]|uniref:16S rRNA (guanine(527)-N(7))-methyltransferase RsmG n=1 Tax=Buchananella hordeovulneris TaxID=52770 RepID=UPI0026DD145F|nr:16S rRNA (guanine(527)-N(7))-methyltransferase RsmG [Buchananella hordeovulneris]MDO5080025.1 16S rRNA (guanine(527)-N(7))-methyltransferase RsmG [Buchananella hordeovulneris]
MRPVDRAGVEELSPAAATYLGERAGALAAFAELLVREGDKRGLLGPRELPRLWTRHLLNSTAVSGFVPSGALVADVGSGAGFPGVVLALVRPDVDVVLIEPMARRVQWLMDVANWLALDNVRVARARADELHGELTVDVVTCRAVAALRELVPWVAPLLVDDGELAILKGARAAAEIAEAAAVLHRFGLAPAWVEEVDPVVDGVHLFGEEPARIVRTRRVPRG